MDNQMAYIYRVSVYSSKRHTKSHTDMYYLKAEHTHWALEDDDIRVHYIQVRKDSSNYESAVYNSKIKDMPLNICCICKKSFNGFGNNPHPIVDNCEEICCDACNELKVIPARFNPLIDYERIKMMKEDKNAFAAYLEPYNSNSMYTLVIKNKGNLRIIKGKVDNIHSDFEKLGYKPIDIVNKYKIDPKFKGLYGPFRNGEHDIRYENQEAHEHCSA